MRMNLTMGLLPNLFYGTDSALRNLQDFHEITEKFLIQNHDTFLERIEKEALSLHSEQEKEYLYEANHEEYLALESYHSSVIHESTFIMACSTLEYATMEACKHFDKDRRIDTVFKWGDFGQDSWLNKFKQHMKKNFEIIPSTSAHWSDLQNLYKVRNCIVHAGADTSLMSNPSEIRNAAKCLSEYDIETDQYNKRLIVSNNTVSECLKTFISFRHEIELACKENYIIGPLHWP